MKISIVMPIYNGAVYLNETLNSIAAQSYSDWELIAVDDGSSDNSMSLIEDFRLNHPSKVSIFSSGKVKANAATCRNIGIEKATSEYLIFLDCDDLLEPFCLQQRIAFMEADATCDWAIFRQYSLRDLTIDGLPIYNCPVTDFKHAVASFCEMKPPWTVTCPIWKKSFLADLKGFDESFIFMEDPELHVRALLKQGQLPFINDQLPPDSFYRRGNINDEKLASFYANSILCRIQFVKKLLVYPNMQPYYVNIRSGFMHFIKVLVLSRFGTFKKEMTSVIALLRTEKVLRRFDVHKIKLAAFIYTRENSLVKVLRLKGLCYLIFSSMI